MDKSDSKVKILEELIFSGEGCARKCCSSSLKAANISQYPVCVQELLSKLSLIVRNVDSCVILEGPTGCGKTFLVQTLANIHRHDLMVVHLGEQIDAKVLLGTFTSTANPGEFVWKPGPLTKAIECGMWLLMEDVDLATPDVLGLLLPLIKSGELMIPGYIQPIKAAKNFMLFITQRSHSDGGSFLSPTLPLLQLLKQHAPVLSLSSLTASDLTEILKAKYPELSQFIDIFVSAVEPVNVHIRQLLKVCERVSPQVYNGKITSVEDFMLEVMDCMCCHLSLTEKEKLAVKYGGLVGGISRQKIEQLCRSHRPTLHLSQTTLSMGRAHLPRVQSENPDACFAQTSATLRLLESVCRCVQMNEPVLLVGETGVGKTAIVNYLSKVTGNQLVVFNMSEQTESTDLLGGFKPVQISNLLAPVKADFERLFHATFSLKENGPFLSSLQETYSKHKWKKLLKLMAHSVESAINSGGKLSSEWKNLSKTLAQLQKQFLKSQATFAFEFVEGALVKAVQSGSWILLDEINLASSETLQCLSGLLESPYGSFILPEKLETGLIKRHSEFRLLCCMNPATDIGKKSLPHNIRNRLTEFFVDELEDCSDLRLLVQTYLQNVSPSAKLVEGIIRLHPALKELAESRLQDGTGRKPHYSLRNLCRALTYCRQVLCGSLLRSAYEGFCMSFLSEVRSDYHPLIVSLITRHLSVPKSCVSTPIPCPGPRGFTQVEGFWLHHGTMETSVLDESYILTDSVKRNIKNLARVISARSYPVLLQGPTSAGKTSMIQYLAKLLGHKCVRINNHEHTDLQEYVGMYTANSEGQLVFQEGVLVDAMKHGYWIILDELNLAPTEVLEALNRVLDDNRELFIPETQELVKAHSNFMLFGTQNPPGVYAGRKVLSRAFRNRFIELHLGDIPTDELVVILQERCSLPASYSKKMVAIMKELQMVRSESGVFQGKYGLITLRDLFRWAERYGRSETSGKFCDWEQQLAEDGFMLLGGRLRNPDQQDTILKVIQKHFKRTVDPVKLYGLDGGCGSVASRDSLALLHSTLPGDFQHLVWTDEFQTMAVLVHRAIHFDEPVLLVGATGCGKTSLCQLLSFLLGRKLFSINCHMHTDAADFLGGLRPVRNKHAMEESTGLELFEWNDGVVIQAMRAGGALLIDEISLAGDAVLERLNSILETERKLLVSERTRLDGEVYEITASEGFTVFATMNPGGDFGKKELSPALRNRFVEIWCPAATTRKSYKQIVEHNLIQLDTGEILGTLSSIQPLFYKLLFLSKAAPWGDIICDVIEQLRDSSSVTVSTRDLLTWVDFMNQTRDYLTPAQGFYHGAHLVFVDSLGCGTSLQTANLKQNAVNYLTSLLKHWDSASNDLEFDRTLSVCETNFGISPFYIDRGPEVENSVDDYSLTAPGPSENLFRLLRAMQLSKPLLLEGSPGVGKTSLVISLARASGHRIVRINLSEQTDISDLFGADLPVEGGEKVQFVWRDGPFLKALKKGDWIVLDEMNLASQSVLEGLNACLDHRGEVFIPELGMQFKVKKTSRLFACQNPLHQGGGRKGLPKSFINRFTQVYMDKLSSVDLLHICTQLFPRYNSDMLCKIIDFTSQVDHLVKSESGSNLWEFNLRDVLRWCSLMLDQKAADPGLYVKMLYSSRLRQPELREKVHELYLRVFNVAEESQYKYPSSLGQYLHVSKEFVQVGCAVLSKGGYQVLSEDCEVITPLHCQMGALEVLAYCVKMGWMAIIVGKACTGKSNVVRSLAQLTGHKLLELSVTSVTDTTDILGGYEQVNLRRHCVNVASWVLDNIVCLLSQANKKPGLFEQQVVDTIRKLAIELRRNFSPAVCDVGDDKQVLLNQCKRLVDIFKIIQGITAGKQLSLMHDLSVTASKLESLYVQINNCDSSGRFEWVDSALVEAVKYGHWLLISHANFCSPSVLDRLNALLEPGGVLTLDEKGIVDDHEPIVCPHPGFRLFLTMDPSHGEISRALRNRGIEVFIHHEESVLNVDRFLNDWKAIILSKSLLDSSNVSKVLSKSKSGLTLQQLVTLARCSHSLSFEDGMNIETAQERARVVLGLPSVSSVEDSFVEVDNQTLITSLSLSSSEISIHSAVCMSKRDFIPLLNIIRDYRSHQMVEPNETKILNAALEVFVCSCSMEEQGFRLEVLEHARKMFMNSSLALIVSAWEKVLANAKMIPSFLTSGGHIFPTSNPLSSLVPAGEISLPVTMLPLSAELSVLKSILESHINGCEKSLLKLSQQVFAGAQPKECLPHSSMMYLHPIISQIMSVVSQLWLNRETVTNYTQSFQMQEFLDWFTHFVSVCLKTHSSLLEFVSSWSLFKTKGLMPLYSQQTLQREWTLIQTHLLNMKPLEDSVQSSKVYNAIQQYFYCLSEVSLNALTLSEHVVQCDEDIKVAVSPMEPFMMYPLSVAEGRLNNFSGSYSALSLQHGSPMSPGNSNRTFVALTPLLVSLKTVLVQVLQDSSFQNLKNLVNFCVRFALRLHPLSLKSLNPLLHFCQCVSSGEVPRVPTGLVRNVLNGFTLSSELSEGVLLERSFLSERCFKLFCEDRTNGHNTSQKSLPYTITVENLQSKKEEITAVLQFIWLSDSARICCPVHNLEVSCSLVQKLFTTIVQAIEDTSAKMSGTQFQPNVQMLPISEANISNVCKGALEWLSSHVSEENIGIIEVCLLEVLKLSQQLEATLTSQTYWENVALELSILSTLHRAMALLGLVQSILLSPAMIDPVALAAAENECHHAMVESTRTLLECWYKHYQQMIGPGFQAGQHPSQSFIPHVLSDLCHRLIDRRGKTDKSLTSRHKDSPKYAELHQVTSDIQSSLCAPAHVLKLLDILKDSNKQGANLATVQSWLKAVNGGIQKLMDDFDDYPDIVDPYTMALTMIAQGVGSLSVIKMYQEEERMKGQLEIVRTLLQYPRSVRYESQCHWLETMVSLLIENDATPSDDFIQSRLLKVVLAACRNCLNQSQRRHKQFRVLVEKLLKHLWTVWKKAQQVAKIEALEAQSLYRWKAREHKISQFDMDNTDKMQRILFPSFERIFSENDYSEDEMSETNLGDRDELSPTLQQVDSLGVSTLHMLLLNKPPCTVILDNEKHVPSMELYELSSLWHSKLKCIPGYGSDFQLHGAHIRLCSQVKNTLNQHLISGYNVYKQGSVLEAERLLPIVKGISKRVSDLLQEWPEHPILSQIWKICQEVLSINVNEPLMKLLTGSEYILSKAQEWEAYASSQVSLKVELNNLMQLILDWRKMEMNFYESLLESCSSEVKAGVSHWWFHLFGLCSEVSDDLKEFSSAIQSFMETSPLGEFSSRLQLIDTFLTDMLIKGRHLVADILGNVKGYYSQFVSNVDTTIDKLTAVLVKDFKDQLSVMRWSDGSYWSLKASVQSSHKKLTSLLRKYQNILHEPVLPILTEGSISVTNLSDTAGHDYSLLSAIKIAMQSEVLSVVDLEFENDEEQVLFQDDDLVVKKSSALRRMSDVLKHFFVNSGRLKFVEELNEFAENVMVSVDELSSNSFLENLEEDKIESAINSKQSLKRKMLSELFKELSHLGFSYKKGLDFCSTFSMEDVLQLPTEDLHPDLSFVDALWNKMQYYYQRSLGKLMAVRSAFVNPSKELTLPHVSRCKGYAYSLLYATLTQRRGFMLALRNYKSLKCAIDAMKSSCTGISSASTSDFSMLMKNMCDALEQCLYVIHSLEYILSTAPAELDHTLSPLPPDFLNCHVQERVKQLAEIKDYEKKLRVTYDIAVQKELCWSSFHHFFVTKQDTTFLQKGFACVKEFCDHLSYIQSTSSTRSPIFFFLEVYNNHLRDKCNQFSTWMSSIPEGKEVLIDVSSTRLTMFKSILLAFQKVSPVLKKNESEVIGIVEATWGSLLSQSLVIIDSLNMAQVTADIKDFLHVYTTKGLQFSRKHLKSLVDVVEIYQRLCHTCFALSMMVHAALSKLSSILYSVFATLGSKGFCKPSQEVGAADPDATEFVNMEAGGFAEGSGEKNVSSQAEPENMEPGKKGEEEQNPGDDDDVISVTDDIDEDPTNIEHDEPNKEEDFEDKDGEEEELEDTIGDLKPEDSPEDLSKDMWAPEFDQTEDNVPESNQEGGTDVKDDSTIVAKDEVLNESESQTSDKEKVDKPLEESVDPLDLLEVEQSEDIESLDLSDTEKGFDQQVESALSDSEGSETENLVDSAVEEASCEEDNTGENALDSKDSYKPENSVFSSSEPNQNAATQSLSRPDSVSLGPSVDFTSASQSGDYNGLESLEDSNQNIPDSRRRRAPKDQNRVIDNDLKSSVKRARLEERDSTVDIPGHKKASIYRHINEAEYNIAENTVWDWSESQGRQSFSDQEETSMEEETECRAVEDKAMNIGAKSSCGEINSEKQEKTMEESKEHHQCTELLSGNVLESFFSKPTWSSSLQAKNVSIMREEILADVIMLQLNETTALQKSISLWRQYTSLTQHLTQALYEELCLVLTPTSASQLRGDYRSGKRLNMRRIIPFIASNYQNDKIWLRRTKLLDRRYQVILAVDDSSSMQDNHCRQMAYESLAVITSAITRLTNGQVGVCRFGLDSEVLHSLDQPFTDDQGGHVLQHLTFTQSATSYKKLFHTVESVFLQYPPQSSTVYGRLLIILSDGRGVFSDGGMVIEKSLRQLTECGVFTILVILDTHKKDSIAEVKVPMFYPEKGPIITPYLEVIPFPFYIIIRDLQRMPLILGEALRQWFELLTNSN